MGNYNQEIKAMKAFAVPLAIAMSWALVGCHGQNPFVRTGDPIEEYRDTLKGAKPYDPNSRNTKPVEPDNTQIFCAKPFEVFVEDDVKKRQLSFIEQRESSYTVSIVSNLGANPFGIEVVESPEGVEFKELTRAGNKASFSLTWKPAKIGDGTSSDNSFVIRYTSDFAKQNNCEGEVRLSLRVKANEAAAEVSLSGLPSKQISYGPEGEFAFQVLTSDSGTSKKTPLVGQPVYETSTKLLNGAAAVDCNAKSAKKIGPTQWSFDCKFTSTALTNVESLINSGKTAEFQFSVPVQMPDGSTVVSDSGRVKIEFKNVTQTSNSNDTKQGGNE